MARSNDASDPEQTGTGESARVEDDGRPDGIWQKRMMVGVALTGLLSILAIVVAVLALANPGTQTVTPATPASTAMGAGMSGAMGSSAQPASATPVSHASETVKLTIKSDEEKGKLGPDGKYHDAFLPANFTVHAGDTVKVTVYNYDDMPHSFTSSSLSPNRLIDQKIPMGSESAPSVTTFTFTAPSQTGKYEWWCALPCDPFSMATVGFMRGYVTVAA